MGIKPLFLLLSFIFLSSNALAAEKALFISVLQKDQVLTDYRAADALIEKARKEGARTLFVQVYRANKAWFPTEQAESIPSGLDYLIGEAHAAGIEVHAWLNLLSLSANEKAPLLEKFGSSILARNIAPKNDLSDYKIDNQYFLEPGDPRVAEALSALVADLLTAYPALDGVQFDYIRYPDVQPSYGHTEENLRRFAEAGGKKEPQEADPAWREWKRNQVTSLVRRLREKAKAIKPGIQVSTTGLVPYARAREESFQDWKMWVETGLADFVTLMAYTDDNNEFKKYLEDAQRQLPGLDKANIAVGAYKFRKDPAGYEEQRSLCEAASPRACVIFDL